MGQRCAFFVGVTAVGIPVLGYAKSTQCNFRQAEINMRVDGRVGVFVQTVFVHWCIDNCEFQCRVMDAWMDGLAK